MQRITFGVETLKPHDLTIDFAGTRHARYEEGGLPGPVILIDFLQSISSGE
jgi:hypothetical protein